MTNFSFRKHYMGNVDFSETVNKHALSNILSEQPVDLKKLINFTLKTTLPSIYRPVVWKLLSGITSRFAESQVFVREQHKLIYKDLLHALDVLQLSGPISHLHGEPNGHSNFGGQSSLILCRSGRNGHLNSTKIPEPEHFFLMWLISEARLMRNPEAQLNSPENQKYILIGHKLHSVMDDPVDTFHICSSLWSSLRKNENEIRSYVQSGIALLRHKNDSLHRHLSRIGLFSDPLLEDQALCLFCEIFPESPVDTVFDKIFANSFDIITYLVVALLNHLQDNLHISNTVESVRNVLYQIRKEQADVILTTTLEIWHKREYSSSDTN